MSEDSIERDGIKWGAPIQTGFKRPEWFKDGEPVKVWDADKTRRETHGDVDEYLWSEISSIVLPADHPYYAQKRLDIEPALVERMKRLIDHAALNASGYTQQEARSILTDMFPNPARKFKDANPNWVILDRAELIERVLAWKETNA